MEVINESGKQVTVTKNGLEINEQDYEDELKQLNQDM